MYIGNTKISELYLGGQKIAEAYLGSTKVYGLAPLPPAYDSYRIKVEWTYGGTNQMFFQGVNINGTAATSSQFSGGSYYAWGNWNTLIPSAVIDWNTPNDYHFEIMYLDIVEPDVTSVDVHAGKWFAGSAADATVSLIGVKDNVETVLGSVTKANANDVTYSVSV